MLQLLHVHNPDTDEAAYLRVIERKTAVLFAAATRLGALVAGADAIVQETPARLRPEPRPRLPDRRRRARLHGRRRHPGQEPRRRPRRRQGDLAGDPCPRPCRRGNARTAGDDRSATARPRRCRKSSRRSSHTAASTTASASRCAIAEAAEACLAELPDSAWTAALRGLARYAIEREPLVISSRTPRRRSCASSPCCGDSSARGTGSRPAWFRPARRSNARHRRS